MVQSAGRLQKANNSGIRGACWALLLVLTALSFGNLACRPATDATTYTPGDVGEATIQNGFQRRAIWFGGCSAFVQEKLDGSTWVDQGGDVVCVWEGFATPLAPNATRTDSFTAREVGTWRLAYDVGLGCSSDAPLTRENCRVLTRVTSNSFEVVDPSSDEFLCVDTGGEWDPISCGHYTCGAFPDCDAVIPGCNCGSGANFEAGVGCVPDSNCPSDIQILCEDTGGRWDPTSCGHYSCGYPPVCAAIIPGCDCGPFAVFDEVAGCLAAPCGAPTN